VNKTQLQIEFLLIRSNLWSTHM